MLSARGSVDASPVAGSMTRFDAKSLPLAENPTSGAADFATARGMGNAAHSALYLACIVARLAGIGVHRQRRRGCCRSGTGFRPTPDPGVSFDLAGQPGRA